MCDLHPDVEIRLPASPPALAVVRAAVRDMAAHGHVDQEQTEVAVLLASEASSNVIRHTSAAVIDLTVGCLGDHLVIRVADDDPTPITPQPLATDRLSGRGLLIIDKLAGRWGVNLRRHGKELWVETADHQERMSE